MMTSSVESPGDTISVVINAWNDMIENENESLRERVSDLEKKVHHQNDEITCLRSTLADVLRRLNQLETNRGAIQPISNHSSPSKDIVQLRHRKSEQRMVNGRDHRRPTSYTPGTVGHPRYNHYQSSGSLHSDGHSSASGSPIQSPSPTHSNRTRVSPRQPPTNLHISKRWNSTGDFQNLHHSPTMANRRVVSGSLLNLHVNKPQQNNTVRHGMKEPLYNSDDGVVRIFMRGRPVNIYVPSNLTSEYSISRVGALPSTKLRMDWVYGYRGRDCRANVYLLPTGEIVYFIAAVVVLYNMEEQMQRHYLGHTDDVKCLAIHPNKLVIASGQCAGHDRREARSWRSYQTEDLLSFAHEDWPHVRIWNSVTLHTLHVIGVGDFEKSVCCIAFSKADNGSLLCVIDEATDHNMSIWDWQKGEHGHRITETKSSSDTVIAAEFHPMEKYSIITCGKNHVSFWNLDSGMMLGRKMGIFENRDKPKYVSCLAFTDMGDLITGDTNGNIFFWAKGTNTISKTIRSAHDGPVFSIFVMRDGSFITGGGKDYTLVHWDRLGKKNSMVEIPEEFGSVRTIAAGPGSQLLVGTTRNCILAGNMDLPFRPVVLGHTDELWALAIHPTQKQFITAGRDRVIYLWDTMTHSVVWSKNFGDQANSACFSPDGSVLVIGTLTGRWLVMDAETREVYSSHADGAEPLQVVKFSPDGQFLALGSRDNNIYIYQVGEGFKKYGRIGKCMGHSSYIIHLDWSQEGHILQSNSGDYELLFWNAAQCRQIQHSSQLRDMEWSTQTCTLCFNNLGVWPEGADGTDVNTCSRSSNHSVIATGDDWGKVRLYASPACQPKSLCHIYGGHSSHVTNVGFIHDDTRLVSLGGRDGSIIQWEVV